MVGSFYNVTDFSAITDETRKIDIFRVDGLDGVPQSLAHRLHTIERHHHSYRRVLEKAATPIGELHVADSFGTGAGAFIINAGNNDWGAWVQILGENDTPRKVGNLRYDLHDISIELTEKNATYFMQVAIGDSGPAGLSSGDYTDAIFFPQTNKIDSGPIPLFMQVSNVGIKAWARCLCKNENTGTISFYIGLHEYEG